MPSSDSEDFESADEGHTSPNKKERKNRLSSSNYSDNLESDHEPQSSKDHFSRKLKEEPKEQATSGDGWDDFDIDEEPVQTSTAIPEKQNPLSTNKSSAKKEKSQAGWDDFDDWADNDNTDNQGIQLLKQQESLTRNSSAPKSSNSTKNEGWGWGWGVDSLLTTATAGISTLTTQVSQGISTVLETGIGAPDPEELARKSVKNTDNKSKYVDNEKTENIETKPEQNPNDNAFQLGSLFSGVTKFVETTGTKVIAGGLDTLETIGKKTMEVLQDGDPGLAKKRAMLGLDTGDKPVLSQVLREAKEKADEEDLLKEAKREAKEVHYETLFDDFEGLVHLEALEMLSRQVRLRIDERLRTAAGKRQELRETLQQVAELCEMPEEEDDEDDDEEKVPENLSKPDAFHEQLQRATRDIGLKLQFQPLIKQYTEILTWSEETQNITEKTIYKKAVSSLAQTTALSMELYHKTAEMLLVKNRRSTADEADALTQMTVVLTKHISELATQFTEKLSSHASDDKEQINNYITNVFLEAGNSSKYIENAFQLILPIIQIGAV